LLRRFFQNDILGAFLRPDSSPHSMRARLKAVLLNDADPETGDRKLKAKC